jgi:predicted protein tyrosine phosphatase
MIIVCPFSAARSLVEGREAGNVLSILGPETAHHAFDWLGGRHLKLTFHDISEPMEGFSPPTLEHVEQIVDFATRWDRREPLLIHCWAGISRSTAAALTAMCLLHPEEDEADLARELRRISPSATPNRLMVAYADGLLGRRGRLVAAADSIGRGEDAYEGKVFRWSLKAPA